MIHNVVSTVAKLYSRWYWVWFPTKSRNFSLSKASRLAEACPVSHAKHTRGCFLAGTKTTAQDWPLSSSRAQVKNDCSYSSTPIISYHGKQRNSFTLLQNTWQWKISCISEMHQFPHIYKLQLVAHCVKRGFPVPWEYCQSGLLLTEAELLFLGHSMPNFLKGK